MSIRLRNIFLFSGSFALLVLLYSGAMKGTPIWDDSTFWFHDDIVKPNVTFSLIWKNYGWPLSISIQKFLYQIFSTNYKAYHLINLILHFLNSLLVYRLGRYLQLKYNFLFYLLFLLHPVAVITTAWMIQIKTLLCFFFGLASLLAFLHGHKSLKWMAFSWILFALSVTSKSAALTMPLIFLAISFRVNKFSKLHWLIPFFVISLWGGYRVLASPVTKEGAEKASVVTTIKQEKPVEAPRPVPKAEVKPLPKPKPPKEKKKAPKPEVKKPQALVPKVGPKPKPEPEKPIAQPQPRPVPSEQKLESPLFRHLKVDVDLFSQTMYYYFWQTLLPLNNQPVKGLNHDHAGVTEVIHLCFLLLLVFIFWKDKALIYLGASHFLLVPFLGLYPAPFMNVTWVSDQHLYLVLPPMLAFWFRILEKVKSKYIVLLPVFFAFYFSWKTYQAGSYYKDQFTFFESSLDYNPLNVPIAYNLAMAYSMEGEWLKAYDVSKRTFDLSQTEPVMQKNIFYPLLVNYYFRLDKAMKPHAN